jgi:hypothetical protein
MALTDPNALAALVESLGGTVIPGRTFKFDLPMSRVREVVPHIHELAGLRVEKVPGSERSEAGDPSGINRIQTVVTLELKRKPTETSEYAAARNLMRVACR